MPAELTVAPPEPRLTRKQEAFALEIASNPRLTNTECARRAGCPDSSAKVSACRWMKMPPVKAEIERLQNEILEREGVSRFSILRELASVGLSNILDFLPALGLQNSGLEKLTREQAAAIREVEIEEFDDIPPRAELSDKEKAAAALDPVKQKLKRRITLKLAPKTPALELLGKNRNLWGTAVQSDTPPGLNQFIGTQVNVNIREVGA